MFNIPSIDPRVLEQAHKIGEHVELEVEYDAVAYTITMALKAKDEEGERMIQQMLDTLVKQLCDSFSIYFGIKGRITKYE